MTGRTHPWEGVEGVTNRSPARQSDRPRGRHRPKATKPAFRAPAPRVRAARPREARDGTDPPDPPAPRRPARTRPGRPARTRRRRRAGRPRREPQALRDPPPLGPHHRVRRRAPGRDRRHRVRDLLRAAAGPVRLGADHRPGGGGLAPVDRRPGRGPVPGRRVQRAGHAGEPAARPDRPDHRPAPARLERRAGDARRPVRRLRGGPPRGGGPAGRGRRHRQPRRGGHLRRPGRRRRGRRGDGRRAHRRRGRRRPVGDPRRLLDRALPEAGGGAADRGEKAVRSAVVIGGYPWTDLAPEAVGLAFGALAAAAGSSRPPC